MPKVRVIVGRRSRQVHRGVPIAVTATAIANLRRVKGERPAWLACSPLLPPALLLLPGLYPLGRPHAIERHEAYGA